MKPFLNPFSSQHGSACIDEKARSTTLALMSAFLCITVFIFLFGLIMLYSASYGNDTPYFILQIRWTGIGLIFGLAIVIIGYKNIAEYSIPILAAVFILLVIARFCPAVKGAHRWIKIPGVGSIQPSEFAKIAVSLFLAKFISDRAKLMEIHPWKGVFWKASLYAGFVILMVLIGKDLGTTVLLSLTFAAVFFAAGLNLLYIASGGTLIGAAAFIYIMLCDPMRWGRMTKFLDPEADAAGKGYQMTLSLFALGSGNWTGLGFAESRMKMEYLPEAHTDFILAIAGEELGFVGICVIILAYIAFVGCAYAIAVRARTRLGMLLAYAIGTFVGCQAIINIGVICGAFPTKGMPAPFFSYGGSNLITCISAVAFIVSIALDAVYPDYPRAFFYNKVLSFFKRDSV